MKGNIMKNLLQDVASLVVMSLFIYATAQIAFLGEAMVLASRAMP